MKIVLVTVGSRGDVQPMLALALALQKKAKDVSMHIRQRDSLAKTVQEVLEVHFFKRQSLIFPLTPGRILDIK